MENNKKRKTRTPAPSFIFHDLFQLLYNKLCVLQVIII